MSKRRRRGRRAAARVATPRISIPPTEGLRRRDTIPTDYSQVVADLKLIAVLAIVMIGGLVLLSYLIQK